MITNDRHRSQVLAIVLLMCIGASVVRAGGTISRASLVDHLCTNTSISELVISELGRGQASDVHGRFCAYVREYAVTVFPEAIAVSDVTHSDTILQRGSVLTFGHPEYLRAQARELLLGVKVLVEFANRLPERSGQSIDALHLNVENYSNGIENIMIAHLAPLIDESVIEQFMAETRASWHDEVDTSVISTGLRVPLDRNMESRMLARFERRLKDSLARIRQRLARNERFANDAGQQSHEFILVRAHSILKELTSKAFSQFVAGTTDEDAAAMSAVELVPEYAKSVEELVAIRSALYQQQRILFERTQDQARPPQLNGVERSNAEQAPYSTAAEHANPRGPRDHSVQKGVRGGEAIPADKKVGTYSELSDNQAHGPPLKAPLNAEKPLSQPVLSKTDKSLLSRAGWIAIGVIVAVSIILLLYQVVHQQTAEDSGR